MDDFVLIETRRLDLADEFGCTCCLLKRAKFLVGVVHRDIGVVQVVASWCKECQYKRFIADLSSDVGHTQIGLN